MKLLDLFEGQKEKERRKVMDLALSGNLDDFVNEFDLAYNSATTLWMSTRNQKIMMDRYKMGKKFKVVGSNKAINKLKADAGWEMIDMTNEEPDQIEGIFVKK